MHYRQPGSARRESIAISSRSIWKIAVRSGCSLTAAALLDTGEFRRSPSRRDQLHHKITFEVLPVLKNTDRSVTYPNANDGGSWKTCNPHAEMAAV